MITNNFKQVIKLALTTYGTKNKGGLPVTNISSNTQYVCRLPGWPTSVETGGRLNNLETSYGISVGSGSTPAAATDYNLESIITSGISISVSINSDNNNLDANGNPELKMIVVVTNTGNSSVTVSEIGYFQKVRLSNSASGGGDNDRALMFDRTLLNTPVTIPAGESTAITYTLKTVIA